MLPDVGAGTPLTVLWAVAAFVLLVFTITGSVIVLLVNRSLNKKDEGDTQQSNRIAALEEAKQEQDIRHMSEIHELKMDLLRCQQAYCQQATRYVSREEHHGDILRIENKIDASMTELKTIVGGIHRRVDDKIDSK